MNADSLILRLFGISEPELTRRLSGLPLPRGVEIRSTVKEVVVELSLFCREGEMESVGSSAQRLREAEAEVRGRLGTHVFGTGRVTLEEVVARLLTERGLTLSLAESCTGGLVASLVTKIPGVSRVFVGGVVSYSNAAKVALLRVSEEDLERYGAVSRQVALAMARGVRKVMGSDLALAITGIAGPGGGSPEKPVGLVYMALLSEDRQEVEEYQFSGERGRIQLLAALTGLDWIRRRLLGL
jgi:nicotinamide-nucleotide amidase